MSDKIQRYSPGSVAQREDKNGDYVLFDAHESAINDILETAKADRKALTYDWVAYVEKLREDYRGRVSALEVHKEKLADKCAHYGTVAIMSIITAVVLAAKIWL